MGKLLDLVHRVITVIVGGALIAIFVLYVCQIVLRDLLGATWLWLPDFLRLLFVWFVFLGATALYRSNQHLTVDFFVRRLPGLTQRVLALGVELASAAFFIVLVVKGGEIAGRRMGVPFDTWDLPTGYAYAAAPVAAFLMLLNAVERIGLKCRELNEWRKTNGKS